MNDLRDALIRAKRGDELSFAILYRAVQPGLLRYLRALVADDAEDVAADTWLQIARDIGGFHGGGDALRCWIATVGRHRAMDHLRRMRRRPVSVAVADGETPSAEDAADRALTSVGTDAALAMITALPRDQAEAVLLRVVMGLDAPAAGRVLGKRAGAVRTAAYRGLRRLADHLTHSDTPVTWTLPLDTGGTPARSTTLKDIG
ncbi:RNA polymerase sigma factor [Actinoplanes aureus]|uniref:RNA polymerase sigma factor n=1 Tax=Actinoplanes aureus TaxID=2792083 RepID=A0A931G2S0_9ACTN|nr:RNA polymerase sigma factor [Actinoplanes aureus]MBG0568470.1 RNA polymerase sigma factor [Actinoplanes aureus]